ncbi:MAG: IcmT/TraK family protein [Alphaproteobacteria bacterium]|nr:IcmT/TraK family protein [Alphaproteobacteria bacterium]
MYRIGEAAWWRDTQIPARFLVFDSRVALLVLLVLLHARLWTVGLAAALLALSVWVEWRGMRLEQGIRRFRAILVGRRRLARGPALRRPVTDMCWEAALSPDWPPPVVSSDDGPVEAPARAGPVGALRRAAGRMVRPAWPRRRDRGT